MRALPQPISGRPCSRGLDSRLRRAIAALLIDDPLRQEGIATAIRSVAGSRRLSLFRASKLSDGRIPVPLHGCGEFCAHPFNSQARAINFKQMVEVAERPDAVIEVGLLAVRVEDDGAHFIDRNSAVLFVKQVRNDQG